jgi:choline dehydrogenase-like flavoprotein
MRDVIVAGAGGGGAVIATELAAQGLNVLVLEAGARFAHPEKDWTHFESDANNPFIGYLLTATEQSARQQGLHIASPIGEKVNGHPLPNDPIDQPVGFEEYLPVLLITEAA